MPSERLRILPLGGLGEIGMNCLVLEWMGELVLVDCGVQFPDSTYSGVDLLTPDLSYVTERLSGLRGVVITHGHDDHIGALPFLAKHTALDVYSTPFPKGLVVQKLSEATQIKEVRFHEIRPRQMFSVGPFHFDPIPVQHSIIESLAFAIQTPVGTIVHSGDFKHDANEINGQTIGFEPFEEWAEKGVLLLLSDSTNAERMGHTLSELDIARSFEQIFSKQTGRLIVALFASNIRRVERLLGLAKKLGKKVAFAGRSMHSYTKLAHEQGSLHLPPDTLILLENTADFPDDQVIILATGSQAEPQSALVRISTGNHKELRIKNGDQVILSSRFIPGNERAITAMIDHLYRSGAEVLYESIHQIHVSGHGFQDELMMMLRACRPKFFVPIHGEFRHLAKHGKLAQKSGVAAENVVVIEDGQVIEVTPDTVTKAEKLELRKEAIVEGSFMECAPAVFSTRTNLAKTGIIFAVFLREAGSHKLAGPPSISAYGLLLRRGEDLEIILAEASGAMSNVFEENARKPELLETLRLELRRFFRKRASHKPVALPLVLDV